jgi:hypothetical protein
MAGVFGRRGAEVLRELTGNTGALVAGRRLFGEGIPYFAKLDRGHQLLDDPIVVQGRRALHLRYPVRR